VAKQIREVSCLSEEVCDRIKELYLEFEKKNTPREYTLFEESSLKQLGLAKGASCVTDERIFTAIRRIRTMPSEKISCREMAGTVFLSQSRFAHLFREQTGMTFAAYLIYQRLICAYTAVLRGKTITDAALEAGFSGSAHFADINRRVFGLSARNITKDLIFAKV